MRQPLRLVDGQESCGSFRCLSTQVGHHSGTCYIQTDSVDTQSGLYRPERRPTELEDQMSYHVTHIDGGMESDFPIERFPDLLDELRLADLENPDVSVTHESEWSVALYGSGFVIFENLEGDAPSHGGPYSRSEMLELMVAIAEGRIDDVRARRWEAGYPPR
jgi:hypothetical protein